MLVSSQDAKWAVSARQLGCRGEKRVRGLRLRGLLWEKLLRSRTWQPGYRCSRGISERRGKILPGEGSQVVMAGMSRDTTKPARSLHRASPRSWPFLFFLFFFLVVEFALPQGHVVLNFHYFSNCPNLSKIHAGGIKKTASDSLNN